jgi:hypothetical protein
MSWISPLKEEPADMQEVLIYDEGQGIQIANYYKSIHSFVGRIKGIRFKQVSFWMAIPPVPGLNRSDTFPDASKSLNTERDETADDWY